MTTLKISTDYELFSKLYLDVFGMEYGDKKLPDVLYIGFLDNGDPAGFISGFWQYDKSFYIQFAGVVQQYRMKGLVKHFKQLLQESITYICITENTNINAMKTLLLTGFVPFGGKFSGGNYFVEWVRRS